MRTEKILENFYEYRDILSENIGICKTSFYSISTLSPEKWLADTNDIIEYIQTIKKFIQIDKTKVGRISIVNKNVLEKHFEQMMERSYGNYAKIYLSHNSLQTRLKKYEKLFQSIGYELLLDTLKALKVVHKNEDISLFAWGDTSLIQHDFLTYRLEEFDEILIYDTDKVCGIKYLGNGGFKYVEFTKSNELDSIITEFQDNWNKLKDTILTDITKGVKLDDYIKDIEAKITSGTITILSNIYSVEFQELYRK